VDDDTGPLIQNIESQHTETSEPAVVDPQTNRRATRAIDIFSLGCVFYYVLTRGGHPFDKNGKFMREANIVKGYFDLEELDRLGDYAFEAKDLVSSMLSLDPRQRYASPSRTPTCCFYFTNSNQTGRKWCPHTPILLASIRQAKLPL
jgi:serine/threonine-protein kinase/endoribonuclease IRE1